jgi:hypothetical protein
VKPEGASCWLTVAVPSVVTPLAIVYGALVARLASAVQVAATR